MEKIDQFRAGIVIYLREHFGKISAETLGWLAIIMIHSATVPSLLAVLTGLTDKLPNLDVVFFLWVGLLLMFSRAVVLKDMLNIVTISVGFMIQAMLMALILFR
jgi:hypothetical protein